MAATVTPSRTGSRQLVLLCAAAVLAAPVVVDPGALDPHLPLRFLLVSVALLVGLLARSRDVGAGGLLEQAPGALVLTWSVLALAAVAAALAAPLPWESLVGDSGRRFGALSVLLLFAAFLLGSAVRDRLGLLLRMGPVLIAVITVAMLWRSVTGSVVGAQAVLVGNAGQLGGYLVLLLGAAAVVAQHDRNRWWRRFAVAALPLGAVAVLLTGSHAAAAGVAALVLAWSVSGGVAAAPRALRGSLVLAVVSTLLVAVLWVDRFRILTDSWQGRVATWSVAWDAVLDRPWRGWGPDGFRHGFAAHVPVGFVREYGDDRITDRAHTILLEPLVTLGVVGAVAVGVLLALYLRHREVDDPVARAMSRGLFAAGVFLLAWFPEVDIALILALLAGATTTTMPKPRDRHGGALTRAHRVLSLPVALLLLLATLLGTGLGVGSVVVDRRIAAQLEALATGTEPSANPVLTAASPLSGVTALLATVPVLQASGEVAQLAGGRDALREPRDAERTTLYAELSGTIARQTGDPVELRRAVNAYRHALELAPNHSVGWSGLGEVLLLAGDPGARFALERAAELRPEDVAPRANLAIVAASQGDPGGVVVWLEQACRIAPADPQLAGLIASLEQRPSELGCTPGG